MITAASGYGQDEVDTVSSLAGIEITTSVDRAEIYIGDLITYTVAITHDSTIELIPPPLGANLGAFDVKDYTSDITSDLPDGRKKTESVFILSTFTTGDYLIPPVPIGFNLPDGTRKVMLSEVVPIKVKSLLADAGDSTDVKPMKAPYEFNRNLTRYYLLGSAAGLLLVVIALLVWWRLRKRKLTGKPVDLRPAWEIAFERLAVLKQQDLSGDSRHKAYYIELTEIAREYLGRIYGINVLDMTTEEFLDRFHEEKLPEGLFDETGGFFKHADLVKFAKMVPESGRSETDFDFVHNMVELVRADYVRRMTPVNDSGKITETVGAGEK
jgi:hypothetical protein